MVIDQYFQLLISYLAYYLLALHLFPDVSQPPLVE